MKGTKRNHNLGTLGQLVVLGCATIACLCAASLGAVAQPASAATGYGNVYLVVGNSNCFAGGRVTAIYGAVSDTWTGGDSGDNIIYPRVRFNATDVFNGRAWCSSWGYPGGGYWINVAWFSFYPTNWNQTFWH
jgi:hypothetical protein